MHLQRKKKSAMLRNINSQGIQFHPTIYFIMQWLNLISKHWILSNFSKENPRLYKDTKVRFSFFQINSQLIWIQVRVKTNFDQSDLQKWKLHIWLILQRRWQTFKIEKLPDKQGTETKMQKKKVDSNLNFRFRLTFDNFFGTQSSSERAGSCEVGQVPTSFPFT